MQYSTYKVIKKSVKIVLAVTISLFLLLSLPFILLSINKVQNVVVEKLSDFVEQKTGAILNIKHVSLSFFNTINIDSVEFYSPINEKIAVIPHIHAHISMLELIKGNVVVNRLDIFDSDLSLSKDDNGTLNIQFLIDALNTGKKASLPDISLKLNLVNASFEYIDKTKNYLDIQSEVMNFANIKVNNINTAITFDYVGDSIIDAKLSYFNCIERSGLKIDNISTRFVKNNLDLSLPYFHFSLPNSNVKIDSCQVSLQKEIGRKRLFLLLYLIPYLLQKISNK